VTEWHILADHCIQKGIGYLYFVEREDDCRTIDGTNHEVPPTAMPLSTLQQDMNDVYDSNSILTFKLVKFEPSSELKPKLRIFELFI